MNTKTIFKTLAAAMLMPAMLLTTACSSDDDTIASNPENTAGKGYALPVTINVTRQSDEATTRATYDDGTKTLEFSTGDKLFVKGNDYSTGGAGYFAGTLTWQSGGTFSGTILTENEYSGTIDALFTTGDALATLLPAGYGNYSYLYFNNEDTYSSSINFNSTKTFATSKATAVEQFSFEVGGYNSGTGFKLSPSNAILNFTITGLAASTEVAVALSDGYYTISGNVTPDGSGTATFAMSLVYSSDLKDFTLTVGGKTITLVNSSKILERGKIYNINRSGAPAGPTLADAFTDGAVVVVAVKIKIDNTYTATGTYSGGSFTVSDLSWPLTQATMTKDGDNLVVYIKGSYNSECSFTFNSQDNSYTESITPGSNTTWGLKELSYITVNGTDITSSLTKAAEPPSETITFSGGSGYNYTYSGTYFQATGNASMDDGVLAVNDANNMVISAKSGKNIDKVVFSYSWKANLDALSFSSGTFDGNATVDNVNATSLTVSTTSWAGTEFSGVTVYYAE